MIWCRISKARSAVNGWFFVFVRDAAVAAAAAAAAAAAPVSIHCVYIHIDERGFLVAQQKWTCPFRKVCFVLFFLSLFLGYVR